MPPPGKSRRRPRPDAPPSSPEDDRALIEALLARNRDPTTALLERVGPQSNASRQRARVRAFVAGLVRETSGCRLLDTGSSPLRTYLPDSDVDVTLLAADHEGDAALVALSAALTRAALRPAREGDPVVRNVTFVNAKVKLVRCVADNVAVDVSAGQLSAVAAAAMLEAVDAAIGRGHLFKRSVLAVKTWLRYDCATYDSAPAPGSFPSYCVAVMLLHVFCRHPVGSPLDALVHWLADLRDFDWAELALCPTAPAPLPLRQLKRANPSLPPPPSPRTSWAAVGEDRLPRVSAAGAATAPAEVAALVGHLAHALRRRVPAHARFARRCCNIVDPVDPSNNVAASVTAETLAQLVAAMQRCYGHVRAIAEQAAATRDDRAVDAMLATVFNRSSALHAAAGAQRPDLLRHPCQPWAADAVGAVDDGDDALLAEGDLVGAWRAICGWAPAPPLAPIPSSPSSSSSSSSSGASSPASSPASSSPAGPAQWTAEPPVELQLPAERGAKNKRKGKGKKPATPAPPPAPPQPSQQPRPSRAVATLVVLLLSLAAPLALLLGAGAPSLPTAQASPLMTIGVGSGGESTSTCPSPPTLRYWIKLDAPFAFAVPWGARPDSNDTRFQWFKDGALRRNETSDTFVIPSVAMADAGRYQCVASSARGQETTTVVEVNVMDPPRVNRTLVRRTVREGSSLTLTAHATGVPPPDYQWRKNGVDIPGATSKQLALPEAAASDAGTYSCFVSNIAGEAEWQEVLLNVVGRK